MANHKRVTRVCAKTGRTFYYVQGPGRPPLYHPDVRDSVKAEQQVEAQRRYRARVREYDKTMKERIKRMTAA